MNVPFTDLRLYYIDLKVEIDQAISRVLESGWYILGSEVDAFEEEYAAYCESQYCVGVANGLDALHLALLALGVGPGDEVIVPSNTYIATWLAVSQCGAIPVPVEPLINTYNIDPKHIEDKISSRTKVIIPVHLYGHPADLDPIIEITNKYSIKILEDAAQCHGAKYKDKTIGSHSDAVAWSFYPGKNLGALGDGGAVTTNKPDIAERIRLLRNYGSCVNSEYEIQGWNSRLDPIQAAVLRVKIKHLDKWNQRRREIATKYISSIKEIELVLPVTKEWSESVWHIFAVRTSCRDTMQRTLKDKGINTLIHYHTPPHLQSAYASLGYKKGSFPISEKIHDEIFSIPLHPYMTDEQVEYVIAQVNCLTDNSD